MVPSTTKEIRSIMALELQNRGAVPDRRVYATIASEYNTRIVECARDMGQDVAYWTPKDVRLHYERCISMVPRLEAAKQYETINRIKRRLVLTEFYTTNEDGIEVVNQKALDNYLKLEARSTDILKSFVAYQKADISHMQSTGTPLSALTKQQEDDKLDNGLFDL